MKDKAHPWKPGSKSCCPMLAHIPHASLNIPPDILNTFLVSDLQEELLKMTDRYCDELFGFCTDRFCSSVSRLVCDVERFRNDADEPVAAYGMGAIYTRCSDGSTLRKITQQEREQLLQTYYDTHHRHLTDAVDTKLAACGRCLIIDGHSFHPAPLPHESDKDPDRPDFCIGTDDYHTPLWLAACLEQALTARGYTVKRNSPFSGTLVPMKHYHKDPRVLSVMLEVNRRLYMHPDGTKKECFAAICADISAVLSEVFETFLQITASND